MSRLAALSRPAAIATILCAVSAASVAGAAEPATYLSWPGKTGGPSTTAVVAPAKPSAPGAVSLSKQFFGGADDMAAPPPPLMPRNVPGTQAVNNSSTINTASNRARQNELMTADSAADGPTGSASNPN